MDHYTPLLAITVPAITALIGLIVVTRAMLKGWQDWLALQSQNPGQSPGHPLTNPGQSPGTRIEIADLKERVRQLEAIAAGVEL